MLSYSDGFETRRYKKAFKLFNAFVLIDEAYNNPQTANFSTIGLNIA
jgi:hypothetical protein